MATVSLVKKVLLKFKHEGISGVIRAVVKRVYPFIKGICTKTAEGGVYHVLYVVGCTEGESKRYRVYNLIEAMATVGITAQAINPEELPFQDAKKYSLVVFFRCEYSHLTQSFLKKCKEAHVPTIFDIDDLVFDESIVEEIDAYKEMNEEYRQLYISGVRGYRTMLDACDCATASTEFLCNYIEKETGKPTYLIRNGINSTQIRVSSSLHRETADYRKIGYLSGSKTHQKDFEQVVPALVNILRKHEDIILTVVGFLDIPEQLLPFQSRIEMIPFMDYQALLHVCAQLYMVVVPLEYETVFCQAKSELKYFEQALVGVPVIASPTQVYRDSIQDGENGFLAENDFDWEEKIERLLQSDDLRCRMGEQAKTQVRTMFYPDVIAYQAKTAYDKILLTSLKERVDEKHLTVSFVIPEPFEGAGGHRNIFRAARAFAQKGHRVIVYTDGFTGKFLSDAALKRFVTDEFFDVGAEFHLGCDDIAPCDLLIATQWHTAYVVQRFRHRCILPCYFIQDFEPYFYPMGEDYVQSYATYSFGFTPIASGSWAASMTEKVSGKPCPYFTFPLQSELYCEDERTVREPCTVAFFARPQMPRRCYMLGVEALRLLKAEMPHVRIVFYGADARNYAEYGFEYEKAGLLGGPKELAQLYQKSTVGLCFSLTNPSLVPYEMMACGLPVVDLDFNESAMSYGGYDAALLAAPTPQMICDSLIYLLKHPEEAERRRANGRLLVSHMPNEKQVGEIVIETFMKAFRDI